MNVHCYGVVPLRKKGDDWQVYLIQNRNGNWWGLPKGHSDGDEDPKSSAQRELFEETGLEIQKWLDISPIDEYYVYKENGSSIDKCVTYFFAQVEGTISLQKEEIVSGEWLDLSSAINRMTYPEGKVTMERVCQHKF